MIKRMVTMDEFNPCLYLEFNVPNEDFDLKVAARQAAAAYAKTPSGRETLADNCGFFNWGDLVDYVPADLCKQFGFEIVTSELVDCGMDHNELLVEED